MFLLRSFGDDVVRAADAAFAVQHGSGSLQYLDSLDAPGVEGKRDRVERVVVAGAVEHLGDGPLATKAPGGDVLAAIARVPVVREAGRASDGLHHGRVQALTNRIAVEDVDCGRGFQDGQFQPTACLAGSVEGLAIDSDLVAHAVLGFGLSAITVARSLRGRGVFLGMEAGRCGQSGDQERR